MRNVAYVVVMVLLMVHVIVMVMLILAVDAAKLAHQAVIMLAAQI